MRLVLASVGTSSKHAAHSSKLFFEIFVAEDVRCGADEAEADAIHAGVAGGEVVVGDHDDFVRGAMLRVVYDFVNSRFENAVAGAMELRMVSAFFGGGAVRMSLISFEPCRTRFPETICGAFASFGECRHSFHLLDAMTKPKSLTVQDTTH